MCTVRTPKAPPPPPPAPPIPEKSAIKVEDPLTVRTNKAKSSKRRGTAALQVARDVGGLNIPMG